MASSPSEPKVVDLTDDGNNGTPGKKKLKQMRLPFKMIDKNELKTKPNTDTPSSDKKRKISENAAEETTTPSKKERTDDGPGIKLIELKEYVQLVCLSRSSLPFGRLYSRKLQNSTL